MTDNRHIVAIDKTGKRMEWTQQGVTGTVPQAIDYLDQLKSQLTGGYAQNISDDPHQGRMDTALAVMTMVQDEGWDHPQAGPVISSVGSALHLLMGTRSNDSVVIDLASNRITMERAKAA